MLGKDHKDALPQPQGRRRLAYIVQQCSSQKVAIIDALQLEGATDIHTVVLFCARHTEEEVKKVGTTATRHQPPLDVARVHRAESASKRPDELHNAVPDATPTHQTNNTWKKNACSGLTIQVTMSRPICGRMKSTAIRISDE